MTIRRAGLILALAIGWAACAAEDATDPKRSSSGASIVFDIELLEVR